MKKVLSVLLVLGLLLSVGFAAENSFNTQIDNSINTVKQAFIAKKIDQGQADLLAKLTVMSLIEKVAFAKIKANDISDKDYLQALDKCDELSNNITSKITDDLKDSNYESLNTFNAFINGYKQKSGNILTYQQNCIENIKEFTGNKFGINSGIYTNNPDRMVVHNPDGTWSTVYPGEQEDNGFCHTVGTAAKEGLAYGTAVGVAGTALTGGAINPATVAGVGVIGNTIAAAAGYAYGSCESGPEAHVNHNYHYSQTHNNSSNTNHTAKPTAIPVAQNQTTQDDKDHPVIHVVHKPSTEQS